MSRAWIALIVIACGGGGGGGGGGADPEAGDGPEAGQAECMPFGEARDPESLPACCQEHPEGSAHCLPEAVVPTSARDDFAPCAGGGLCLPDPFIASGGRHAPTPCESALGPGACLSICIPRVAKYAVFLVRDVCASGELCAPCFEPGGGPATGACDLPLECEP